ncbi:hypothetical protein GQ54DRAFT_305291 [Martensiomyces pterosporus]|nr:hypothetical protein GQ54DRAFT_305291 [Martensiomyces pterosporus]
MAILQMTATLAAAESIVVLEVGSWVMWMVSELQDASQRACLALPERALGMGLSAVAEIAAAAAAKGAAVAGGIAVAGAGDTVEAAADTETAAAAAVEGAGDTSML